MDVLLNVLQARNIRLGEDDVQWAFESSKTKTDVTKWVQEYLTASTLLSKDEAQLSVLDGQIMTDIDC